MQLYYAESPQEIFYLNRHSLIYSSHLKQSKKYNIASRKAKMQLLFIIWIASIRTKRIWKQVTLSQSERKVDVKVGKRNKKCLATNSTRYAKWKWMRTQRASNATIISLSPSKVWAARLILFSNMNMSAMRARKQIMWSQHALNQSETHGAQSIICKNSCSCFSKHIKTRTLEHNCSKLAFKMGDLCL